jgi:hypothetical protein
MLPLHQGTGDVMDSQFWNMTTKPQMAFAAVLYNSLSSSAIPDPRSVMIRS